MKVIFRYDDFSASPAVACETDVKVFALFRQRKIPLLVAVTPRMCARVLDPTCEEFHELDQDLRRIELLKQGLNLGWELALHGLTHRTLSQPSSPPSEFVGLAAPEQMAKIKAGLQILERCFPDRRVKTFVPPWNSFDAVTLECLAAHGFRVLCGGSARDGLANAAVSILPSACMTRSLVDYLRCHSLNELHHTLGDAWLVVTMHGYEFDGSRPTGAVSFDELDGVLRSLSSHSGRLTADFHWDHPSPMPPVQEYVFRGRVFLSRRRLLQAWVRWAGGDAAGTKRRFPARVLDQVASVIGWIKVRRMSQQNSRTLVR